MSIFYKYRFSIFCEFMGYPYVLKEYILYFIIGILFGLFIFVGDLFIKYKGSSREHINECSNLI